MILPPDGAVELSQFLSCSFTSYLSLSLCLCWPLSVLSLSLLFSFSTSSPPFLCLSFRLSAAQSPTVTDPLQQAYAGVQHYAGDPSLLYPLLSHFLHLSLSPLPSPSLFVTSVDTMTGRDSRTTSQFPPGLDYFTLGLQKDFSVDLIIHPHKKILIPKVHRELRIWTCHSLLHERWHRLLITAALCLTSALINMV